MVYFPKISRYFKPSRTYLLNLSPAMALLTLEHCRFLLSLSIFAFHFFDFMNPLKEGGKLFLAPSNSIAMCLYILLALPLALFSSSNLFVYSYPLALQSTLNCLQLSLLFNLSLTPLLFVLPLSTLQFLSILHSLHY